MPATLNRTPVIRRFVKRYMPEHLLTYGIGLVFLFATTAVIITIPKIIGQMIDQLRLPEATFTTVQPTIVRLMLLAGLLFLFRAISRVVIFFPGRKIEQSLRQTFFNRLTMLPRRDTERFSIGDLMSRGVNDISAVRVMVSMGILHVINTAVLFTGAVHGMASLSPQLTAWVVVPILAMFVTTMLAVRFIYGCVRQAQVALGELSESVREILGAYQVFNSTPIHAQLLGRFAQWNHHYSAAVQRVATARAFFFPILTLFVGLGSLVVLWQGGRMVMAGGLPLGSLVAFLTYVWILADPAVAIGWVVTALQRGHSSLVRLYELIEMAVPQEPGDAPALEAPAIRAKRSAGPGGGPAQEPAHTLQVRDLRFRYTPHPPASGTDTAGQETRSAGHQGQAECRTRRGAGRNGAPFELFIDRLDLHTGMRLGIFGPTGCGKSTLAELLAGVLEAPPGSIMINGIDVRQVPVAIWRRWVSFVPQQSMLFSTTIAENIQMARPPDAARLAAAISCAVLGAEVANFPQGLATSVGESGVTLSGGQRQRVSVARAYYHGGRLVILDDTTSAVDAITETRLLAQIRQRLSHAMLVIISHRVSTLQACDEILLLEHGRIVDRGTHAALCQRSALYRATWDYERRVHEERGTDHGG